jgi:hypothetical protein
MSTFPKLGLRTGILTVALASSLAAAPSAFAADQTFKDADVVISGGDAVGVAVCLNWAKTYAGYSDAEKKRHDKVRVVQANKCKDNLAIADGGGVSFKNVDVTVGQAGKHRAAKSDASLTISGGDATAVAACVNVLNGGTNVEQINKCGNTAIATGGSVKLVHTDITIKQ